MKKIYILMGNPDKEGTLSAELADVYENAAHAAGHEVRRANIGDVQFDPFLHKGYKVIQQLEPDLLKMQEDMRWADHFVLIYPIWWSATPALLKGLFDRMWLPGFAFHFWKNGLGWDRLLKGKTARVITLSKMPPLFIRFTMGDFTNEIRHATLGFAGYKVRMTEIGNSEKLSLAAKARVDKSITKLAVQGK
ncbi:MAG: Flavodoxin-like fold family protein [Parcubacteria group bacterium]|nr:Flavodoxin-like fold family protein [Parcubacteria group bacterium]